MPKKQTIERARRDEREGKSASTQAGEFVREEIEEIRAGKHGARSTKQAIAIGLSKARRAGVKLAAPKPGKTSEATRKKAQQDLQNADSGKEAVTQAITGDIESSPARKRRGGNAGSIVPPNPYCCAETLCRGKIRLSQKGGSDPRRRKINWEISAVGKASRLTLRYVSLPYIVCGQVRVGLRPNGPGKRTIQRGRVPRLKGDIAIGPVGRGSVRTGASRPILENA